jgi:AcrR family transcriptional regulator
MLLTAMSSSPDGDRQRNAERTRTEILDVATTEFARLGYSGARVDEIAALTTTTKRMIYYYFGSKEQLYIAVLERAFEAVRPEAVVPEGTIPDALSMVRRVTEHTFDQHLEHPELIRLLAIENIHEGRHIATSNQYRSFGYPVFNWLDKALDQGIRQGTVRPDIDARDIFMIVFSYCTYRVSNRFTFEQFTGRDLLDPQAQARQRQMLIDMVLAYISV